MSNIVEMCNISKSFGSNKANQSIDFFCRQGEVVCLLGENGAGKSTLMKILYGQYKPDNGEIFVNGHKEVLAGSRAAINLGIQMVHQHFMLVPTLSVTDNVMIGKEVTNRGLYDRKKAKKEVERLMECYGLKVPTDKLVCSLSVGEQQRVEIIKALYQGAKVLILDEPTAVLTHQEVEELFDIIRRLKADGKTIILITHKLKETMAISDRVYVMRKGQMVGSFLTNEISIDELSERMVGQKLITNVKTTYKSECIVLKMKNVSLINRQKIQVLKDVNLEIHECEILGIAGVEGNGQMELVDVLTALDADWNGLIELSGVSISGYRTANLLNMGVSCIHADRQKHSIAMGLSVPYNMMMGYQFTDMFHKKIGIINWPKVKRFSEALMEEYDVRPREIERNLSDFSGGNQQKFVVGRELVRNPKFLIAAHPTRGVDIMATSFIHSQLNNLKANGAGILLISSDMDELMALSDRIAVMYDGRITDCRYADAYTMTELGSLMGGGKMDEKCTED